MKILIIRNFPSYFSVKNNTYNIQEIGLAKALVRKGHICDIVFWTDGIEEEIKYVFDDTKCITIYYKRGKTAFKNTVYKIDDLIKRYDIIQPCEYNQIQSWILSKKYPQKTIIYHGPYYSDFNKNYNRMCKVFDIFLLGRYKKQRTPFIVKSELAKSFLTNKGLKNVTTVGVGIDSQVLTNGEENCNEPLYNEIKSYDGIKLLYIGRIEPRRNLEFVISIIAELNKTVNSKLFIIGNGEENYTQSVMDKAIDLGIEDKIVWQKKMEQKYMSEVYKYADYFLLPTYYEIFGMVLLEAMYFNKVVLTTENGGSNTIIENGENGYILPQNDLSEWVEKITQVESNLALKQQIGQLARRTIEDRFTWDRLVDSFIDEYSKVGKKNESIDDK